MMALITVILAAGKGQRMKSDLAKVLHTICGLPMAWYVIRAAHDAGSDRIILVVGHQRERVMRALGRDGVEYVVQEKQLGTAHALAQARRVVSDYEGDLLVLAGDTPLLTGQTLRRILDIHHLTGVAATVLTAVLDDPVGYGRIVRRSDGMLDAIVEEKDATPKQKSIREINTGAYCFRAPLVFDILDIIDKQNRQGEYYLTDAIAILRTRGLSVAAVKAQDWREVLGINSAQQLTEVEKIMIFRQKRKTEKKG